MKTKFILLCALVIASVGVSGCRPANTPPTPEASSATNAVTPATPPASTSTNQAPQIPTTGEPTKP